MGVLLKSVNFSKKISGQKLVISKNFAICLLTSESSLLYSLIGKSKCEISLFS